MAGKRRMVLGGAAHGKPMVTMHGSTMLYAPSNELYRRHGAMWWVPAGDTDAEAEARVSEYRRAGRVDSDGAVTLLDGYRYKLDADGRALKLPD